MQCLLKACGRVHCHTCSDSASSNGQPCASPAASQQQQLKGCVAAPSTLSCTSGHLQCAILVVVDTRCHTSSGGHQMHSSNAWHSTTPSQCSSHKHTKQSSAATSHYTATELKRWRDAASLPAHTLTPCGQISRPTQQSSNSNANTNLVLLLLQPELHSSRYMPDLLCKQQRCKET